MKKLILSLIALFLASPSLQSEGMLNLNNTNTSSAYVAIKGYLKERDEAAIIEILNQSPQFLRYEALGCPSGTTEKFINSPKYITRVLQEDGKTVGFVNCTKMERKFLFLNFGFYGFIHLMGVNENYRGKQYGKELLFDAIECLKNQGMTQIKLGTKITNLPARSLYEKSGFKLSSSFGEQCIYSLDLTHETRKQKILQYANQNPTAVAIMLATMLGGGYLGYKSTRALIEKCLK